MNDGRRSGAKYFMARIRGGDVAAVGSIRQGAPPMAMRNTYVWVDTADETAVKVRDAGGTVLMEPFDVLDSGRMAVFADPEGAAMVAEMGGPPGFEDVVASLNPIADDQPDVSAHGSLTFATDDADATATRTTELGATVIVPPFDAPWVRMTVIADPQGATLIASQFVPENRSGG